MDKDTKLNRLGDDNFNNQFDQIKYFNPSVVDRNKLGQQLQVDNQDGQNHLQAINPQNLQNNHQEYIQSLRQQQIAQNSPLISSKSKVISLDQEINMYFSSISSKNNKMQGVKEIFLNASTQKIQQQLKFGNLYIKDSSKELILKNNQKNDPTTTPYKIKKDLQNKKQQTIQKLKQIQKQQLTLQHNLNYNINSRKNHSSIIKISTPEDNQSLKQKIRLKKQFQLSIEKKNQELIKIAQQMYKQKQQKIKNMYQEYNRIKKLKIKNKLKQLEIKSQERKQILKNSVVKQKIKYSHRKLEKQFKNSQKLKEKQTEEVLKSMATKNRKSILNIKDHEKKYLQNLEKRSQNQALKKRMILSTSLPKIREHNYFSKLVQEQIFETKAKMYQKLMKIKEHQFKNKVSRYQQKIDQQYKPIIFQSRSIPVIPRTQSLVALTHQQRFEKGLQYLQKAKALKKQQTDMTVDVKKQQPHGNKIYKDYLIGDNKKRSNINATKQQLQYITSNNQKDFDKLMRAKFLSQGLQAKKKISGDNKMYFSIKNKLSLLQNFY